MVASCVLVGSLASDRGLPTGRFCIYRSSLSSLGGGEGERGGAGHPGLGGEPPPLPPAPPAAGSSGSGGSDGRLEGGIADHLNLQVGGTTGSWMGLRSTGHTGSGGGAAAAVGALVLEALAGLCQSCNGSGVGVLGFGESGRGNRVAIC